MNAVAETTTVMQSALQLSAEYGIPVFPCRPDKRPYTEHGFKDATTNLDTIEEWWRRWPDALIGVPTGKASGLFVLDVDPDGLAWYQEHAAELCAGRIHQTRRKGYHLLYKVPQQEIRCSAGQLSRGIDVRAGGGYAVWWPAHDGEAIGGIEDIGDAPAWLLKQLTNGASHHDRDHGDEDRDAGVHEGGRNDYLSREAFRLRKQGLSVEQIIIVLRGLNAARCSPPLGDQELETIAGGKEQVEPDATPPDAAAAARPETLTLDEMLARFVHVARGPMIVDVENTNRRLRPGEFSAAYAHLKVVIEKKAVPVTSLWAQSDRRMLADCMTFHPGQGQFFQERGLTNLNFWTPPAWPDADAARAAPFLDHLAYLIPDTRQREDLLDWLAHTVQRPDVRPHFHFLLVAAQEGTGRSWLVEVLRRLWGERHAGETDLHRLLDDAFNSQLSGKILMAVHEVKAPADERYSHRDRIKSLLTDSILTVNEKHEPRWTERFCARFLMFTNRDDALPLSETDRRVYVIRCADQPREPAYYVALYARIEDNGFLAAVWKMLATRDISQFNPGRRAPLNEIKQQMIAAGRTDEQQTAVELVQACPYDVVAATDLMRVLVPEIDGERYAEHKARIAAVAMAMRETGAQTHGSKIWLGASTRVWILRHAAEWASATPAALKEEAEKARQDIIAEHYLPDSLIELWRSGT